MKKVYDMDKLSVVIITFNEEKNIGRCLDSVQDVADEIIVLDSFSTDNTMQIAVSKGADFRQHSFQSYTSQKNRAINMASHNLVLSMDADEALTPALAASIREVKKSGNCKAYSMNRCNIYKGKPIRHGLWYPDRKIRLFDKRIAYCGGLNPHDRIELTEKVKVKQLKGDLLHYTYSSLAEYLQRNQEVSMVAAQSLFEAEVTKHPGKIILSPLWAFVNGYILRLGFLDGADGFTIALHTANQSYMKYQRLRQLRQTAKNIQWNKAEILE